MNDKYQIPIGLQSVNNDKQIMYNQGSLNNFSLHIDSQIQNHVFNINTNQQNESMNGGKKRNNITKKGRQNKLNKSQKIKN
jgi:hypothetical protein